MTSSETGNGGTILLLLASRDPKSTTQIITCSGLSPAATFSQLHRLTELGFIIASSPDDGSVCVYRLNPKGVRTEVQDLHRRILVIDDTDALRRLMQLIFEEAGYAFIATAVQADAVTLLKEVAFDLVITDSFSKYPSGAFVTAADIIDAAAPTPVALFSAHRLRLEDAQAAGFADLIDKPFDVSVLERQVRALLAQ